MKKVLVKIRHFGKVITMPFFTKILSKTMHFFRGQKRSQKSRKLSEMHSCSF